MKITMLLTMGIERPSGQRYFNLARGLVQQGHCVRLLALHPDLERCPHRRFIVDGVQVWYVGQMHVHKRDGHVSRFGPLSLVRVLIQATLGMLWGIICSPADVYHLGKPQPINGVAALLGVMLLRWQRFFVDCDDDETESNRFNALWQRQIFGWWQTLLPRIAQGITVNTTFLREHVRRRTDAPIVLVSNGIDLQLFQRPAAAVRDGLRRALGLQPYVIGYVGTVALHNHPVHLLLEAFAQLSQAHTDISLLIIGNGEDVPQLQTWVHQQQLQHVHWIGHVQRETVATWTSLCDITVDPVYDNAVARARSPLKIMESLALGIPVVTGDVGDRALMLDDGRAGILVRPGDSAALAAGIATLLIDSALYARTARHAAGYAQHWSWEQQAQQWQQIYTVTEGSRG